MESGSRSTTSLPLSASSWLRSASGSLSAGKVVGEGRWWRILGVDKAEGFLLGQWLNFKLFGITYLVGKISRSNFFFSGSEMAKWGFVILGFKAYILHIIIIIIYIYNYIYIYVRYSNVITKYYINYIIQPNLTVQDVLILFLLIINDRFSQLHHDP